MNKKIIIGGVAVCLTAFVGLGFFAEMQTEQEMVERKKEAIDKLAGKQNVEKAKQKLSEINQKIEKFDEAVNENGFFATAVNKLDDATQKISEKLDNKLAKNASKQDKSIREVRTKNIIMLPKQGTFGWQYNAGTVGTDFMIIESNKCNALKATCTFFEEPDKDIFGFNQGASFAIAVPYPIIDPHSPESSNQITKTIEREMVLDNTFTPVEPIILDYVSKSLAIFPAYKAVGNGQKRMKHYLGAYNESWINVGEMSNKYPEKKLAMNFMEKAFWYANFSGENQPILNKKQVEDLIRTMMKHSDQVEQKIKKASEKSGIPIKIFRETVNNEKVSVHFSMPEIIRKLPVKKVGEREIVERHEAILDWAYNVGYPNSLIVGPPIRVSMSVEMSAIPDTGIIAVQVTGFHFHDLITDEYKMRG